MIDTQPDHTALQPENAIIVPKWNDDPNDKGLVGLIPFLECESSNAHDWSSSHNQNYSHPHSVLFTAFSLLLIVAAL